MSLHFEKAGKKVLAFLHERLGFGLWMITRTEGNDWIVLQAEDHGYNVKQGDVFRWTDSFCSEMVQGNGPSIAPNSGIVPAYANAPIGRQVAIKAYIGFPLTTKSGALFGTLCAIDPAVQPPELQAEHKMIELFSNLLSTILQADAQTVPAVRNSERLETQSLTDATTMLYNRNAWESVLLFEEGRCRTYGYPCAVMIIDVANAIHASTSATHNALYLKIAAALRKATCQSDVVARLSENRFGIMAVESTADAAERLRHKVMAELAHIPLAAEIGMAMRTPAKRLQGAWQEAEAAINSPPVMMATAGRA